ncbi:hypothetical protein SAMN05444266_102204 [Chitinophaga jiangningensis]|uniref:Uncharacterized protein n=1 Tax=Chitinophaga jiangningensis TaxID=1419482 RepID=A0A1M6Y8U4_9BACT|nr:hypothetical protein [Chitinophaga jiangningensis]SHL14618.1 hypothetical protein SAMN05444266_102204 [Chitinophaga jiangningensis]
METLTLKCEKTRELSIYDFFVVLQVEWLQADIRQKIYQSEKDKKYWGRVKEGKENTILKIAERNNLPNLFNDSYIKTEISNRVFQKNSYPLFTYKNADMKAELEYLDLLFYYYKGSEVWFELEDGLTQTGTVAAYQPFDAFVTVNVAGVHTRVPVAKTRRTAL